MALNETEATIQMWLDQQDDHYTRIIPENLRSDSESYEFIPYGTAGFRANSEKIKPLLGRIGLCAAIRCFLMETDTGIMVTASHNPIQDNGVKIIGSKGEMLDPEWESVFEKFVNYQYQPGTHLKWNPEYELFFRVYRKITTYKVAMITPDQGLDESIKSQYFGQIHIGRDTRPSSEEFVCQIKQGIDTFRSFSLFRYFHKGYLQITYRDFGVITTPALHYLIARASKSTCHAPTDPKASIALTDYYNMLLVGFIDLNREGTSQVRKSYDPSSLVVDCANGVGLMTMQHLLADQEFVKHLPVELINTSSKPGDILNHECGADFVKTKQLPPKGACELNKRYASLDGDADRVVYFFLEGNSISPNRGLILKLIDGDKILALYVKYIKDMLKKYDLSDKLTLGAVQTAYANGASTDYLKNELELVNIDCVDTGVKNLHKKALDYDLGVYFEANGHGSIWVSNKAKSIIDGRLYEDFTLKVDGDVKNAPTSSEKSENPPMGSMQSKIFGKPNLRPVRELQQLLGILNNYTGDAVSDILIAETILKHYDWNVKQWFDMYQDRSNSLIKVEIADRSAVVTTDAGRRCLKPEGLQEQIEELVRKFGSNSRSFVRASGTENVVRIYAEASDQDSAERLSKQVGEKVTEMCSLPK